MQLFVINSGDKPIIPNQNPGRHWWDIMLEGLANAVIVGIMAFVATIVASQEWSLTWKAGLIAAGLAFLVEMRKVWPKKEA